MISHTAYFGDGAKTFTLTDTVVAELQHKTGLGIGALFLRMSASQFHIADIVEVIRLGLIGGNVNPQEAQLLVDAYAKDRPIDETLPLALDILDARWNGKPNASDIMQAVAKATNKNGNINLHHFRGEMSVKHGLALADHVTSLVQGVIENPPASGDMTTAISVAINAALEQVPA